VTERVSKGDLILNEADLNGVLHKHSSRRVYVSVKYVPVLQDSNYIITALFWVITQPVVVKFLPTRWDNLSDPSSGFEP